MERHQKRRCERRYPGGDTHANDTKIALIEAGVRLLEFSAAYRAAFEEHTSAQAEAMIAINKHRAVWERANTRFKAAEDAMWVAHSNLLCAALDINVRHT